MISPTIGRVVLFYRAKNLHIGSQAYPALVSYVHSDRRINVGYFDSNGAAGSACSVLLIQDDEPAPENGHYAEWMPYQKAVAAKS